ncbi:MAG TPA: RHS repeat domain-containing protein [Candidatus Acidoferrales bacterium]|nr:RHS repeat domain-containing protein [Candidatus Acidoferrales bacterium]
MRRSAILLALISAAAWGQVTLDCNQPADVTFSAASPRANLRFQSQQGEALFFRFVGTNLDPNFRLATPVVTGEFGSTGATQMRPASATPADLIARTAGFELDVFATGTFILQLAPSDPALSGTIHVELVRLNRPCPNNVGLSCGHSAAGSISSPTATAPPARPGQIDTYTFSAQTGDVLAFRLLRLSGSGSLFEMAVYGPDGHAINVDSKTNQLSYTGINSVYARVDLTSPVTGTLTVLVFEPSGSYGGNYFISAMKLNGGCGGPALTCGGYQDSQITTPLSIGSYSLQATQGDVWQFRLARADNSGSFNPYVEVFDAQGNRIGTVGPSSPVPGQSVSSSGHAAVSNNIAFPSTGTYSVFVQAPLDGSTGGYTLATARLNKPCAEQALGCSSIVDGGISGLLRAHIYSLPASAGDNFLIRLLQPNPTALFRPRIDVYDGAGTSLQFVTSADLQRADFTAPADGTYAVIVADNYDGSQSGNYTLSFLRLNRPCNAGTLSCGAPAGGSLARSLDSAVYQYAAAALDSFSVRMIPTGTAQPSIEVYDSHGNPIGQAMTGAFPTVDVPKPAADTYTIVALDNTKTQSTGTFALDLLRTRTACGQSAAQGQSVTGVLSATEPFTSYTISAAANDVLSLRSASSTAGFTAQMEIYDPDGNRLDSGVFGLSRTAAATGTYTVIVGSSAVRTAGGYAFAWQLLNKPAGVSALACGTTTGGSLAGASQFRYYTVPASAGDTMRMIFTRTGDNFSPQVELFDPSGTRVSGSSDVTQKASGSGSYLVVVSPSTAAFTSGSYTLSYQRPNNPCSPTALACGQSTLRQVILPGQLDTLTFHGTGGDLTSVRLATRSGAYSPFAEMYNAAGTLLTTSSNGVIQRVLPADGTYTLLVRDSGGINLGSYRASVQDNTNNCNVNDTEAPVITLLKPTGGEVVSGGTTFHIQWLSDDNVGVATHDIALSTDGGKTFPTAIASGLNGNLQAYDWPVPSDTAPTRTAAIRVTATDGAGNAQSAASGALTLIGSGFTPNTTATYTYDALNRVIQAVYGDGRAVQYIWDAAGNLVQVTVTGQ